MKKKFNGIEINFRVHYTSKERDNVVLLLHGWGGSLNSFRALEKFLISSDYSTINLDFPGFGASELPKDDFDIFSYAEIIFQLIKNENLKNVSVVAHSFGGRVAILLSSLHPELVKKLILVDSAGINYKKNFITKCKIKWFKFLKFLSSKKLIKLNVNNYGSKDYKALPESLKPIFVRIINQDLTTHLTNILAPTLLIWGEKDKETPMYFAKKMHKSIKDSAIIVFKKAGHFSYLEHHAEFEKIVDNFFKGENK